MDAGINPTTGDLTGQRINTLANAVYIRLMTPLGSWWADPTLGSRLHELRREKDRPRVGILAKQYAELKHDAKGAWRGGKLPFEHPCPQRPGSVLPVPAARRRKARDSLG